VAHAQPLADLALDEARRRIYVVNTASSQVEVYSTTTNPPRLTNTIKTDATPLSVAVARNGARCMLHATVRRSLYVIDLTSATFASRSVTLRQVRKG
jgi:DNA-binding beta-propeller fold protein YncE